MDTAFEPDGRLKTTKAFKKNGQLVQFTAQGESALVQWVGKHFAAHGKNISPEDARQLIFFTGGLMNTMIPEIDKIAAYAQGDTVTRADILAVAQRIPEAVVYELTDCLANQDYDGAMRILADLSLIHIWQSFLPTAPIRILSCCSSATMARKNRRAMRGSTPSRRTLRSSPSATTITATRRPRPLRACRRTTYPLTAPTAWATSRCISREETLWPAVSYTHLGFFTGHLSNLFSGALEVDIYACKSCGKLEFYRADAPSLSERLKNE